MKRTALLLVLALTGCGNKPAAPIEPQFKWTTDQVTFEVDRCSQSITNATDTDQKWCRCWIEIAAKDFTYEYYGAHGTEVETQFDTKGYFKLCDQRFPRPN